METNSTTAPDNLAAFDAAQAQLAATPTPDLLRAAYALTHRIHNAKQAPITAARVHGDYAVDLRQQRDMIDAEILRRTDRRHLASVVSA